MISTGTSEGDSPAAVSHKSHLNGAQPKTAIVLEPGQMIALRFNDDQVEQDASDKITPITKVQIVPGVFYFADSTLWDMSGF